MQQGVLHGAGNASCYDSRMRMGRAREVCGGMSGWCILLLLAGCASTGPTPSKGRAELTVRGDQFLLDGAPFEMWGIRVASASQNDRLTADLIANLDDYRAHGVNTLAVFYMGSRGANSDPFSMDGLRIDAEAHGRIERIIRAAAARGMVVVVGLFYQHAPFGLRDAEAVRNAVRTVTAALRPYGNVVINIANEQNSYGWEDSAAVLDFRDPQTIIGLAGVASEIDPRRLVGGGGYDHAKNVVIGRSAAIDVLLFDTNGPDPHSGELYDRFVSAGIADKPLVNVELFGGWTGKFERGLFPDPVRRAYLREVEAAASRPGLSVFFHNNLWLQTEPIRYDLGGSGVKGDPGIRWYFDAVRHRSRGRFQAERRSRSNGGQLR